MPARALMFQGTGSDVGKSLMVAGLARALTLRGLKVRPFKPQNMSNNAAVAADGGEDGRAHTVEVAEHVDQCGGDARRRRDRPCASLAGPRGASTGERSHESGIAQATKRD